MSSSTSPLANVFVVVAVFAMPECGHCEEYVPRFLAKVEEYRKKGYPFVVYKPGVAFPNGAIPVLVLDVSTNNDELQTYANRFAVSATPTTVVQKRSGGVLKTEGALSDVQIDGLLGLAHLHNLH